MTVQSKYLYTNGELLKQKWFPSINWYYIAETSVHSSSFMLILCWLIFNICFQNTPIIPYPGYKTMYQYKAQLFIYWWPIFVVLKERHLAQKHPHPLGVFSKYRISDHSVSIYIDKIPSWFIYTLKFEKYCCVRHWPRCQLANIHLMAEKYQVLKEYLKWSRLNSYLQAAFQYHRLHLSLGILISLLLIVS